MMILAQAVAEEMIAWELVAVFLVGFFLANLVLVLPGALTKRRNRAALGLSLAGMLVSGSVALSAMVQLVDAESAERSADIKFGILMFVAFFAIFVTGCYGVWRWFRLPRR